jgi:hypothetical protein
MYFMPSFAAALLTAATMAATASALAYIGQTGGGPLDFEQFRLVATRVAPVAFLAVFLAWPICLVSRAVRAWWRRNAAGI